VEVRRTRIHVAWRWLACLKKQKLLRHVSPQEHRSSEIETTLGLTPPTRAKSSIAPGNRCLGRAGDHRRFSAIESLSESDLLKCVDRPLKSNDSREWNAQSRIRKALCCGYSTKGQLVGSLARARRMIRPRCRGDVPLPSRDALRLPTARRLSTRIS